MMWARRLKRFTKENVLIRRSLLPGSPPTFGEAWLKIKHVEGWLVPGQEKWLFETVKRLPQNANILEIGAFKGRSTVSLALACIKTGRRVFSIDTFRGNDSDFINGQNDVNWEGKDFFLTYWNAVKQTGSADYVVPLAGFSHEIAPFWKTPLHMLFVDASHQYEDVIADFNNFFPHVVPGGIVAFHDVTPEWADVYRAWNDVIKPRLIDVGSETTLAYGTKA